MMAGHILPCNGTSARRDTFVIVWFMLLLSIFWLDISFIIWRLVNLRLLLETQSLGFKAKVHLLLMRQGYILGLWETLLTPCLKNKILNVRRQQHNNLHKKTFINKNRGMNTEPWTVNQSTCIKHNVPMFFFLFTSAEEFTI